MSVKRLNGWEPVEIVDYIYDDDGRVVRSVTRREPEWDNDERAWALALLEHEASRCPGCGGQFHETTDIKNEVLWTVPPPTRCHRCTAIAAAKDKDERNHPEALFWTAHLRK